MAQARSGCYSFEHIVQVARTQGFTQGSAYTIARIVLAESGGCPVTSQTNYDGSIDRGYVQFNSRWHSEVTNWCAYNLTCSLKQAYRVSQGGSNFHAWTTYNRGLA